MADGKKETASGCATTLPDEVKTTPQSVVATATLPLYKGGEEKPAKSITPNELPIPTEAPAKKSRLKIVKSSDINSSKVKDICVMQSFPEDASEVEFTLGDDEGGMMEDLIQLVGAHRFRNVCSWTDIGRALHYHHHGEETGFAAWRDLSRAHGGLDVTRADYNRLGTLVKPPITVRTIGWYARIDSPERYKKWHDAWCQAVMTEALSLTHAAVARVVHRVFWLDYLRSDSHWYYFADHRLKLDPGAGHLINSIQTKLVKTYKQMIESALQSTLEGTQETSTMKRLRECHKRMQTYVDQYTAVKATYDLMKSDELKTKMDSLVREYQEDARRYEQLTAQHAAEPVQQAKTKDEKKHLEVFIKQCGDLIKKLENQGYCTSLDRACRFAFTVERLEFYKNSNPNLLGCVNGIVETHDRGYVARHGKPEDYVTMSTGICFNYLLHWEHEDVQALMRYLKQMFWESGLLEYMLETMSGCIHGNRTAKVAPFFVGLTDAGKSTLFKLFEIMLGDYFKVLPGNFFEKEVEAGAASSESSQLKGTYLANVPEGKGISADKFKRWVDQSTNYTRDLFEKGVKNPNTAMITLCANLIGRISNADSAVKNRIIQIPCLSQWPRVGAPVTVEEQEAKHIYPRDDTFESTTLPLYREALLWVLCQFYTKLRVQGPMPKPRCVQEAEDEYWRETDVYLMFRDELLVRDETSSVTASDLYKPHFLTFSKDHFNKDEKPTQARFTAEMKDPARLGAQVNRRWVGWRLRDLLPGVATLPGVAC